jgi:PKD domain
MKHFNNSLDGNVNVSNIPEFEPDYSPKSPQTEKFIVFLLIALGVAGTFYTFNISFKSNFSKAAHQITKNISSPVLEASPQLNTSGKNAVETQLMIDGAKESNQRMKFTIPSFDKKAKYDLFMGDGVILHPNNKTVEYAYRKPGNYHIQLKVSYDGKSEKIFSKNIEILESIAIAPNAHQEY